jgi:hypothetical protein
VRCRWLAGFGNKKPLQLGVSGPGFLQEGKDGVGVLPEIHMRRRELSAKDDTGIGDFQRWFVPKQTPHRETGIHISQTRHLRNFRAVCLGNETLMECYITFA